MKIRRFEEEKDWSELSVNLAMAAIELQERTSQWSREKLLSSIVALIDDTMTPEDARADMEYLDTQEHIIEGLNILSALLVQEGLSSEETISDMRAKLDSDDWCDQCFFSPKRKCDCTHG
jgi:hypothetical protein